MKTAISGKLPQLALLMALLLGSQTLLAQRDLTAARPESVGMSPTRLEALDAGIQAEVDKGNIAGVVVAIA